MHSNGANIVWMCLKGCHLFRGVIIVNAQLEIIGTGDNPILPCDKATSTDGDVGELKRLDDGLGYVRPYMDMA